MKNERRDEDEEPQPVITSNTPQIAKQIGQVINTIVRKTAEQIQTTRTESDPKEKEKELGSNSS